VPGRHVGTVNIRQGADERQAMFSGLKRILGLAAIPACSVACLGSKMVAVRLAAVVEAIEYEGLRLPAAK
jgi:hypothetical protein